MILLAVDTSSPNAGVALLNEQKLLGEFTVCNGNTHSQYILPMVDELLQKCGIALKDVDVFAVAAGPGSFTGLRIGIATVKTFAQVCNKPVVGVSSLEALVNQLSVSDGTLVCPVIDARRDRIYSALFDGYNRLQEDRACCIGEVLEELKGKKVLFVGDGALAHREEILSFDSAFSVAPTALLTARSFGLAQAAMARAVRGDFDDLYALSAIYLRQSQAEREYAERNRA
ncbi:MAG: tRNA (adenosine(37)-N6)-threonylcarbamoyltransferase complex dimerization subunit type 1 TsaB [Ruminococcaceae bacterium]|nr:tRNA (adenosine(37)-N6)-threonylcarbamoyltransferase complex dimerization subunit type 1 TsaB [Oscillospiraceae bacterium]